MNSRLIATLLMLGAACTSPSTPAVTDLLTVTARSDTLQIDNASAQRVFFFIYERQAAALIDWAPCVDESRCSSVAPGAGVTVPYSAVGGYASGKTEAIVWWWYAVPGPADQPVPGKITAIVVRL